MKFETARAHLEGVPFIEPEKARVLYDFIMEKKPRECLELGFAHGTSACYIAAALDELGEGRLTTVDLTGQAWQVPSIEELLTRTGLGGRVGIVRERTSYTWFLRRMIEERTRHGICEPLYDFCFIDGSKNWTIDGCAFFLADKLLRPGGWVLFDDLKWTYASTGRKETDGVNHRELGPDELNTPHIESIFRLLVMQHPDYSEFVIQDDWWGWAHKIGGTERTLAYRETQNLRTVLLSGVRGAARFAKRRLAGG